MPHGTSINGTAYGITGGKCLVNGTVYGIKKGRTLVGGTGYDITFSKGPTRVSVSGDTVASRYDVNVNGQWNYSGKDFVYDFEEGVDVLVNVVRTGGPVQFNGETLPGYTNISVDVTGTLCTVHLKNRYQEGAAGIIITTEDW